VKLGCVQADNAIRPVGIPVPASLSASVTTGDLLPGWYQTTITYFYGDEEGGAYPSVNTELPVGGGITLTLPSIPIGVTAIGVYLSGLNGEVPFLYGSVSPSTSTVTLAGLATGQACRTQFRGPMPAGELLAHLDGRLLSAAGSILSYSDEYNFGMTHLSSGYIPFPADITVVQPCSSLTGSGVYVVADKTYWLTGIGTEQMSIADVLPYGAVKRSSGLMRNQSKAFWLGARGLVIGDSNGQVQAVQEKDLLLDLSGSGASVFIEGNNRIVTTNG
jgi:hypothetical protein